MGRFTEFLEQKLATYNRKHGKNERFFREFFKKYVEIQMLMGRYPIKDDEQGYKEFIAKLFLDFEGALASDGDLETAWQYMVNEKGARLKCD